MTPPPVSHAASQTRALWILAVLASLACVKLAAELLIPIVLAVLASLALEPVVAWLVRHRVPRAVATALVLGVLLGGLGWGAYAMKDRLVSGVQALPRALQRAQTMVLDTLEPPKGAEADQPGPPEGGAPGTSQGGAPGMPRAGQSTLPDALSGATAAVPWIAQSAMAAVGDAMVIVFLMFFLLYSGPTAGRQIVAMARTEERRKVVATILHDVNMQVQRFLLVRLITSVVGAAATWAVLAWMGAENAVVWGVLAGVFNSIPYFGPVIVSGGLFVVGLVQGGTADAVRMAGAALVITTLEGWLLEPPLMGRAERMNVLSVFLGLLLWTWLWGGWGTLLAVPMLAVVKSVADHVDGMKPLGRLMAPWNARRD